MSAPLWLAAADQYALATIGECADALAVALLAASAAPQLPADPPRQGLSATSGQLLVMPSTMTGNIGVKLVTVADPDVQTGGPRIQGVHVQFDSATLAPRAILDGIALTNTRTAAVSVLALRYLADPRSRELLVFGAGPQAASHIRGIVAEWPVERVRVVSRRPDSARQLIDGPLAALSGIDIAGLAPDEVAAGVGAADIIVCATTSAAPVFDAMPTDRAAIVAVGSHSPAARELPGPLVGRAYVVVEERGTALREAGDIVLSIADGVMTEHDIDAELGELVRGAIVDRDRPRVFKSVGMAWQDAVVADAILARS